MKTRVKFSILLCFALGGGGTCPAASVDDLAKTDGVIKDSARGGIIIKAHPETVKITEQVVISRDVFSVTSFTVDDGAAAADFLLAEGITEMGGPCGFVKGGLGTMAVEGAVTLSGVITIYDGTLDFSQARLADGIRVNVVGNAKFIPPSTGTSVSEIYINGTKLKSGRWGVAGSVAAGKASFESPRLGGTVNLPDTGPSRREIWKRLKYGIFSHYVWNGYGMTAGMPNADGSKAKSIDELAESFDVENYVDQLVKAEAQYVVFTAWHSGTCPLFPSAAMAKWAPGRPSCPKFDLLGKVLDVCRAKGIRTFFYCHPYQPVANPHNDWINDLYAELVDRYGSRLDGLWIDENFQDCTQDKVVDYRRLMKTIKERNPDLVLTHNNGGYQSYGVDEGVQEVQWEFHEGRMASTYQIFNQTAKSPEDMLITTVIQSAANTMGGGIQWSIDAHGPGDGSRGGLDAGCRPILDGFVKLFQPIMESVKNTNPSSSYPPPFSGAVVKFSNLSWGVATKSADDSKEYLHVLKPPAGNVLTLPPPVDGKVFANARLLSGGRPIGLMQSNRSITLTLPEGIAWQKPDTVIVMDVMSPGGVGLINNTSRALQCQGASWQYLRNGNGREFRNDSHRATAGGDSFSFTFNGTDVAWISSRGPDRGVVELAIDGVSQGAVDLTKGSGSFLTVFSKSGLTRGNHTLTGTKRGGALLTVDAFQVSELINDSEPDVSFPATTNFDARSAEMKGPWEPRGGSWINGTTFNFRFQGTEVEVRGGSAHGSGDLVVSIDGKVHATVHCHGGQTTRSLAKITGLPYQEHAVSGEYTNRHPAGFIPALDGFTVTRPDFWKHQTKRGRGEINDDVHVSEVRGSTGACTFEGSGVEVYTTMDADSRTAHYTLDGGGSSLWVGLNQYSPVTLAGRNVFSAPNLVPGKYTVGFKNDANATGVNFTFARLNIDALRIYKAESSSATPLFWGASGQGGSGTWDVGRTANWHDGVTAAKWEDLGAGDYAAIFAGAGGKVNLSGPVRVNRISCRSDGYRFQGENITLVGSEPTISTREAVKATVAAQLTGTAGITKVGPGALILEGENSYSGGTKIRGGVLMVSGTARLGSGDLVVSEGAVCRLENAKGSLRENANIILATNGKLHLAAGVSERVGGLTVNGVVQPAGNYTARTHPTFISGEGTLSVTNGKAN